MAATKKVVNNFLYLAVYGVLVYGFEMSEDDAVFVATVGSQPLKWLVSTAAKRWQRSRPSRASKRRRE